MKCSIVYYLDGKWYGEEVSWCCSGSGTYREISRIEVPQSKDAIVKFGKRESLLHRVRAAIPVELQSA
ncbi:MAG: hypothetical protein U0835_12205 [Isosphaeraceae bacterium]